MKRLLLLAHLFLALPAHAQSDADRVTAFLKAKMRQERIPALQVAVIRHGKIVKNAAYGVANVKNREPASTESAFSINSCTKAFTRVAIMQLAEAGSRIWLSTLRRARGAGTLDRLRLEGGAGGQESWRCLKVGFWDASVNENADLAALDSLKARIQGLRAKTTDNGCTEAEALSAAAKVAELLDRYDLSLTDVEIREAPCERREYETRHKKRIPLEECIGAVANFCDCRAWREKTSTGDMRYVFFGLRADIEAAHYLTELIDSAVRSELGRYKTSASYQRFRHKDRHVANSSFTLGMVTSIAEKLTAMKTGRDQANNDAGRHLVVLKSAVVNAELDRLDLKLETVRRATRMVSTDAYDAGGAAGASLAINPSISS